MECFHANPFVAPPDFDDWRLINRAAYYDYQQIICTGVSTVSVSKMQGKRIF